MFAVLGFFIQNPAPFFGLLPIVIVGCVFNCIRSEVLPPALPELPFAARIEAAQLSYHVYAAGPRRAGISQTVHWVTPRSDQAEAWKKELWQFYRDVRIDVR